MRYCTAHSILFLLLGMTIFLLASCRKQEDAATRHRKNVKHSKEAVTITQKEAFDFSIFDTAYYYYGVVQDSCLYFKIDEVSKDGLEGHFYPVGKSVWLEEVPFSIVRRDDDYYFKTKETEREIRFSVTIDTACITGEFTPVQSRLDKRSIYFERHREPAYTQYDSPRYRKSVFSTKTKKNIKYGSAKGYWTSYAMNDSKYLKMFTKTISKTAKAKDLNLDFDLYYPDDDTLERHPLIVFIHGGAYYFGDKGALPMATFCSHFAKAGYVAASINYRLGFKFTKTSILQCGYQAIQDAHAAVRYLVAHADEYGIDTSAIFLAGASAGSITALNVAFMTNSTRPPFIQEHNLDAKLGKIESSGNNLHNKFTIKGVSNMWGAVHDLKVLSNHPVSVVSFHGTEDNIVPYDEGAPFGFIKGELGEKLFDKMYGSKSIHRRLDELHIRNEFHPLEGAEHSPFQDKSGKLTQYFYYIQDKTQDFFYCELCGNRTIQYDKENPSIFSLSNPNVQSASWKVEGGFITESKDNTITVLWRKGTKRHTVSVSAILDNGASFSNKTFIRYNPL